VKHTRTTLSRAELSEGANLLDDLAIPNLKHSLIKQAGCELICTAFVALAWLGLGGLDALRAFGGSAASMTLPSTAECVSFLVLATCLALVHGRLRAVLHSLAAIPAANAAIRALTGYLAQVRAANTGLRINAVSLVDSGHGLTVELFGTVATGKPLLITLAAPRYTAHIDLSHINKAELVQARLSAAFGNPPHEIVTALLSRPNAGGG
jgi:hypothetical protein